MRVRGVIGDDGRLCRDWPLVLAGGRGPSTHIYGMYEQSHCEGRVFLLGALARSLWEGVGVLQGLLPCVPCGRTSTGTTVKVLGVSGGVGRLGRD